MKTRLPSPSASAPTPDGFPDADSLAALRAWYAGLPAREAVVRYLPGNTAMGQSARGILGRIRRQLVAVARNCHREDLAALFQHDARRGGSNGPKRSRTRSTCSGRCRRQSRRSAMTSRPGSPLGP
jgi:hypothetical protein